MATLLQATHAFKGGPGENFVSFNAGDVFTLISQDADGWWRVRRKNNEEMYVPASYMQVMKKEADDGEVILNADVESAFPDESKPPLNLSLNLDLPPPPENLLETPVFSISPSEFPLPPPPDDISSECELPDGWVEVKSDDGEVYYYNESTHQTQWEKPSPSPLDTPDMTLKMKNAGWRVDVGDGGQNVYVHPVADEKWMTCTDDNGRTYFYSITDVGKTAWVLPDIRPRPSPRARPRRRLSESACLTPSADAAPEVVRASMDVSQLKVAPPSYRPLKRKAPAPPIIRSASQSQHNPSPGVSPTRRFNSLRRNTYNPEVPGHRRQSSAPIQNQLSSDSTGLPDDDTFVKQSETDSVPLPANNHNHRSSSAPITGSEELNKLKDFVGMSGNLQRKKLADVGGKKCTQRNWTQHFVVMHGVHLMFYKDKKQAKEQRIGSKVSLPSSFCLQHVQLVIPDYAKRKNVMQLISPTGEQMYLQADSNQSLVDWMNAINEGVALANSMPPIVLSDRKTSATNVYDENDLWCEEFIDAGGVDKKGRVRVKLKHFLARRPSYEEMKRKGFIREQIFGSHIVALAEKEKTTVPAFVRLCIETIEHRGLDAVGIYRVPGNASQIQRLRYKIDREEPVNLNDQKQWDDINVIAGALKLFLRELAEPLIPYAHFGPFLEIIRIPDRSKKIAAVRKELSEMPQPNRDTLRVLLEHLSKVVANGSINKMQSQNVAIVFGPTLLRPEVEVGNMAVNMAFQNAVVDFLLKEFWEIFAK